MPWGAAARAPDGIVFGKAEGGWDGESQSILLWLVNVDADDIEIDVEELC